MDARRTLRLTFPQWQGGDITGYALGAAILDVVLPATADMRTAAISVPPPPLDRVGLLGSPEADGISSRTRVEEQLVAAVGTLAGAAPDRVLTLGGDCAVSIAPFSWLASRYPDLGVVWIDAHPDMWDAAHQPHANARAAAILSGLDASGLCDVLPATVPLDRFVWVGTRAEVGPELVDAEAVLANRVTVADAEAEPAGVAARLRGKGLGRVAVHFDLDVLDPTEFRGVAVGEAAGMTWDGIGRLLEHLDAEFDLVGVTVAEHVPEGMEKLRRLIGATSIAQ